MEEEEGRYIGVGEIGESYEGRERRRHMFSIIQDHHRCVKFKVVLYLLLAMAKHSWWQWL